MVYGWCWKATNLHLAHEQRWVAYLVNGSHFSNTWEFSDWDRWGSSKWIEDGMIGEKPYGKTLLRKKCWDSPVFNRNFSWFQHWKRKRKTSMVNPTLRSSKSTEVIKVHRWEKIGGNKFGEKNGLPTPQKVVTGITGHFWEMRRCIFLKVYEIWKL